MNKNVNDFRAEKRKQEQKLEALLLERLQNSDVILHTEVEFEKIRTTVKQRIEANKTSRKPVG